MNSLSNDELQKVFAYIRDAAKQPRTSVVNPSAKDSSWFIWLKVFIRLASVSQAFRGVVEAVAAEDTCSIGCFQDDVQFEDIPTSSATTTWGRIAKCTKPILKGPSGYHLGLTGETRWLLLQDLRHLFVAGSDGWYVTTIDASTRHEVVIPEFFWDICGIENSRIIGNLWCYGKDKIMITSRNYRGEASTELLSFLAWRKTQTGLIEFTESPFTMWVGEPDLALVACTTGKQPEGIFVVSYLHTFNISRIRCEDDMQCHHESLKMGNSKVLSILPLNDGRVLAATLIGLKLYDFSKSTSACCAHTGDCACCTVIKPWPIMMTPTTCNMTQVSHKYNSPVLMISHSGFLIEFDIDTFKWSGPPCKYNFRTTTAGLKNINTCVGAFVADDDENKHQLHFQTLNSENEFVYDLQLPFKVEHGRTRVMPDKRILVFSSKGEFCTIDWEYDHKRFEPWTLPYSSWPIKHICVYQILANAVHYLSLKYKATSYKHDLDLLGKDFHECSKMSEGDTRNLHSEQVGVIHRVICESKSSGWRFSRNVDYTRGDYTRCPVSYDTRQDFPEAWEIITIWRFHDRQNVTNTLIVGVVDEWMIDSRLKIALPWDNIALDQVCKLEAPWRKVYNFDYVVERMQFTWTPADK